ncbi:MAG: hypothetical protein F4065_06375 [Rhodothermaceae bacterium]|nr:hypothetical protein [Bacteroidota bacterium]MXX98114.1 hypothetical protein [Rhodothermaceae bacterium]MCY3595477.1 hypothetical protein [Bacteroidota bacterium]MXZ18553.1 hypothetical protein [Rhodothermaceae bacterium]MXZ57646.1 hypothetical protein [Rhodothermaceae bacterium]
MARSIWMALVVLASCDVFGARTPEPPVGEAGTWLQPVAPDLVVDNLRAAVAELNAANYRRSLDEEFMFTPTAAAYARDPDQWIHWDQAQENGYFVTVAEAAKGSSGNLLRLEDATTELSDTEYILDAHYLLLIKHGSQQIADTLQGRLVWVITKKADGLWMLTRWSDQSIGTEDSWSDLKAEFAS